MPVANVIGDVDRVWHAAMKALGSERGMLGDAGRLERRLTEIWRLFRREFDGRCVIDDSVLVDRLASLSCRVSAMWAQSDRTLVADTSGEDTRIAAMVMKLLVDAMASEGPLYGDTPRLFEEGVWPFGTMFDLALLIGSESPHIQRNIIAEQGLGLPR